MSPQSIKRKLTAILSADVKGYSQLMSEDEELTIRTLTGYRELMSKLIQEHRGRVVDSPGDNLLAEFASVVDAVKCAVEIQRELAERNKELAENRRMHFRIGLNLGDVVEEADRIYGDGVNLAARLEGLSEAGGICISGTAYDQVKNKLPFVYEYQGEHTVKNIPEPVRVYRVVMEPEVTREKFDEKRYGWKRWQLTAMAAASLLVAVIAIISFWGFLKPKMLLHEEVASKKKIASALSDKPSIAVLPFTNLSGDPNQEYFSDGITNDIITDLSKFREMRVIASNTIFTYKGRAVKVQKVGQDLGVRYVLEGSVQKAGDKVRINAQLIDASTGHHLWAERYDRNINDLFAVQDEIIETIVRTLAVNIDLAERKRVMRKDTDSMQAYDYLLRGMESYFRRSRTANVKAREMFEKAIELDPQYVEAYAALGWYYYQIVAYGWTEFPDQALMQAQVLAQKALSMDESNASAHRLLGTVYLRRAQYALATTELQKALELNPNDARGFNDLGGVMLYSGQTARAIELFNTALRFDPYLGPGAYMELGLAYYLQEQYDQSIKVLQQGLAKKPRFVGLHIALAAAHAQLGRKEDAEGHAEMVLRLDPFFEVDSYGTMYQNTEDRAKIIEGLRNAGLK